jgi:hypothetical protein
MKRCRVSKEMFSTCGKHEPLALSVADYVVLRIHQENEAYSDQERDGRKIAITLAAVRESKMSVASCVRVGYVLSCFMSSSILPPL